MNNFVIYVDADSCPIGVRDLIIRFSIRNNLKLVYVANHEIPLKKHTNFSMIVTNATPDAADNYIVENTKENDLVITRDIPLANRLLEKKITVINDRGLEFTQENIKEKLSMRNFAMELSQNGIYIERNSTFSKKDLNNFANCFSAILQKKLKN